MPIAHRDRIGGILNIINGKKRVAAFDLIAEGMEIKAIPGEVDISRSGLQNYVDDFREEGLIAKQDSGYQLTAKGGWVHDWLSRWGDDYEELWEEDLARNLVEQGVLTEESSGIGFASPRGKEILERLLEEAEEEQR